MPWPRRRVDGVAVVLTSARGHRRGYAPQLAEQRRGHRRLCQGSTGGGAAAASSARPTAAPRGGPGGHEDGLHRASAIAGRDARMRPGARSRAAAFTACRRDERQARDVSLVRWRRSGSKQPSSRHVRLVIYSRRYRGGGRPSRWRARQRHRVGAACTRMTLGQNEADGSSQVIAGDARAARSGWCCHIVGHTGRVAAPSAAATLGLGLDEPREAKGLDASASSPSASRFATNWKTRSAAPRRGGGGGISASATSARSSSASRRTARARRRSADALDPAAPSRRHQLRSSTRALTRRGRELQRVRRSGDVPRREAREAGAAGEGRASSRNATLR